MQRGQIDRGQPVQWVEVKQVEETQSSVQPEAGETNLHIEYGGLYITAGSGYPVESLITLLREVCAAC